MVQQGQVLKQTQAVLVGGPFDNTYHKVPPPGDINDEFAIVKPVGGNKYILYLWQPKKYHYRFISGIIADCKEELIDAVAKLTQGAVNLPSGPTGPALLG